MTEAQSGFLVLCGISGSGKSYLTATLSQKRRYAIIPSLTTRAVRSGEIPIDRQICSIEDFERLKAEGRLLCARFFFGNWYALDANVVDQGRAKGKVVAQLSFKSIPILRQHYPGAKIVYVAPKPIERSLNAIIARNLSADESRERLAEAVEEIARATVEFNKPDRCFDAWFENDFSPASGDEFLKVTDRLMS